jgi:hypothetical protein
MSSAADNADLPPLLPRPSIFISYASENRPAARLLRDALEASGLDVWYDENELGGGDAWDQKIRRQIRECTYFLPMISAQTEARREGYFRREWRLAVDRSHDMADDVMFLIPVVIDGTPEGGARVPEKFLTVQWLKLPGGVATPALTSLAQRLAHGEHVAPAPPVAPRAMATPARAVRRPAAAADHIEGSPQVPPFPESNRHNLKYFADIIGWGFTAGRIVFKRLPKWVRVLIIFWLVVSFISRCSRQEENSSLRRRPVSAVNKTPDDPATPDKPESEKLRNAETLAGLKKTAAELRANSKKNPDGFTRGINELGAALAEGAATHFQPEGITPPTAPPAPLLLDLIPFASVASEGNEKFAAAVFSSFFVKVAVALDRRVGVDSVQPAPTDKAAQIARAKERGSSHIIVAQFSTEADVTQLTVNLVRVSSGEVAWSDTYPVSSSDPEVTAAKIATAVLAALPKP